MKIGVEKGRIYIETEDYNAFFEEVQSCQRYITVECAIRLSKELNDAITASQPTTGAQLEKVSSKLLND